MSYGSATARMIEMYMEDAPAPMFLSGFFESPARNFHTSEEVTIDIERDDEDIAIVLEDLSVAPNENSRTRYTNKGFVPPIFGEGGTITAFDMIKRQAGNSPFEAPDFQAKLVESAFAIFRKLDKKIRRSVELMASQVFQNGALTLIDENGAEKYVLDFGMKATHKVTVGTVWSDQSAPPAGATPLLDIENLAEVVRRDGKGQPSKLIFGKTSFREFVDHPTVAAALDNRNKQVGVIAPEVRGQGATFQGWVWIGNYRFEMWTYDGWYKHPQTGVLTPYVSDENVIMLSERGRLDLSYGAVPLLRAPEQPAITLLPPRMNSSAQGLDLSTNAYFTPDGRHLKVEAHTRPLTIPTAIDTFARLTT